MSSHPCRSAYRSERCPQLTDSDSDDSQRKNEDGREEILAEEVHRNSTAADASSTAAGSVECFAINRAPDGGTRVDSIARLQTDADKLQEQVDSINFEKERIQAEIRNKRQELIDAIMKVVEYEKSIRAVEDCIADKLHHFQSRIIDIEGKRQEIFLTSGDKQVLDLLESEIKEVKHKHEQQQKSDETDRDQITQQAQYFAASLGDVINEYQNFHKEMMIEMKPDLAVEAMLEHDFCQNMTQLHHLINRPAMFCKNSKGERFYVNRANEKIFQLEAHSSEYKLNVEGDREKVKCGLTLHLKEHDEYYIDPHGREIYTKYHFEDDFGRFYVDIHGERNYKADPEASEYKIVNGNWVKVKDGTYEKDERGMRVRPNEPEVVIDEQNFEKSSSSGQQISKNSDDDVDYIKATVGPAIRKGLAAVALYQPDDPITYFANFLLHYRYNEHMFEKRDKDLKHYLQQRDAMKLKSEK